MRTYAKAWPDRVWAVEGANGTGRPLAQRLLEAGEKVVDVPAKLAARVRLFNTGHNRKTDALDARSIAIVAVRTEGLRVLKVDGELEALRLLTDRREALTRRRVQTVNRLQALLAELLPGQAKKDITPLQAKAMLARVRPRDIAGKTRRSIAAEELAELVAVDAKITKATAELKTLVLARGSRLMIFAGSARWWPPGPWPTSVTSPGSPTGTGSRPGLARHHLMLRRVSRTGTGCPEPGTGG
jgi:transposase